MEVLYKIKIFFFGMSVKVLAPPLLLLIRRIGSSVFFLCW